MGNTELGEVTFVPVLLLHKGSECSRATSGWRQPVTVTAETNAVCKPPAQIAERLSRTSFDARVPMAADPQWRETGQQGQILEVPGEFRTNLEPRVITQQHRRGHLAPNVATLTNKMDLFHKTVTACFASQSRLFLLTKTALCFHSLFLLFHPRCPPPHPFFVSPQGVGQTKP